MRVLLDTHVLVWVFEDDPRLTKTARDMLGNPDNMFFYSDASVWEIGLKHLAHPDKAIDGRAFDELCRESGFYHLSIQREHVLESLDLPLVHRDPFDRLLIAQAGCERMKLMSHDANIGRYELGYLLAI